jgi:aspartate/methionine/tyrosine aminotransferase
VDSSRVVVTVGASAALLLVTAALVNASDEVLVADPSYPCNRHFLNSFGASIRFVPTTATRFQLDLSLVKRHWTSETRRLMIATPANPTGTSIAAEELAAICGYMKDREGWRLVYEIYLGLQDGSDGRINARTVLASDSDAPVINSFSNYFGMTGWRLGWCVVPPMMVEILERLAQDFYICPSAPAQYAAVACFDSDLVAECEKRRASLARRRTISPACVRWPHASV